MLGEAIHATNFEESIVTASKRKLFIDTTNKSFAQEVEELFYEGELQNFFVNDSEDELQVLIDLPFEQGVFVAEGLRLNLR